MPDHSTPAVWFIAYPDFELLDVCGPLEVFELANAALAARGEAPRYATRVMASSAGMVRSSSGVELRADALPKRLNRAIDTVIVSGGPAAWSSPAREHAVEKARLAAWTRRAAPRVARLASVCTGAFVLAQTGLLDGRRVVTHWSACGRLQAEFPSLRVEENAIHFRDGPFWTSAGVTAGIDMALAMVEADLGAPLAMSVAKRLVVFYKRPGGQSQFSSALLGQAVGDDRIASLHAWLAQHLRSRVTVQMMADRLTMTPRTFARFYVQQTGHTPARALEQIRLERACRLIESTPASIKAVASRCGFSSEEIMRRAFLRTLHVSPSDYRQRFSVSSKISDA